jgi:Peptidase family M23/Phage tail lysozyme
MPVNRKNPFMRVSIGGDLFQSADGKLIGCSVTLGEGETSSSCTFKVRASKSLVDKYFTTIYNNDGLDPVVLPSQKSGSVELGEASNYDGSVPSLNGVDASKTKKAINFYLNKGLSTEGACYLVGNYIQESSLNHLANNNLGNIGLAQWDTGRRATNGGIPLGVGDFEKQMSWALAEMITDSTASGFNHDVRSKLNGVNINAIMQGLNDWERFGAGELGGRFSYGAQLLEAVKKQGTAPKAKESTIAAQKPKEIVKSVESVQTFTGSQITIELGFNGQPLAAYSFLHTSIDYDLLTKTLTFGGQAATWILTQRIKSTAYKDCTLEQIAQKICDAHGIILEYKGTEIKYEYFPQLGMSDYETLLLECRRVGYRLYCDGGTMTIAPREARTQNKNDNGLSDFTLIYGDNLTTFTVNHSAGGDSGGVRSSSPAEKSSTGESKFTINPDSGEIEQTRKEDKTGAGTGTTGYHTSTIKPKTTGETDEKDKSRRENELRIRGIIAQFSCPCDSGALLLTPDSIFQTFQITNFLDRVWTVESVTHDWSGSGFNTSGTVYSPMKNKYPQVNERSSGGGTGKQGDPSSLSNPGGFIHPTANKGRLTSPYGQRGGRLHAGVDVAPNPEDPFNIPIYASAEGIVDVQNIPDGYGLNILIDHNNGFYTLYGHLSEVLVTSGTTVKQGANIAKMGYSGHVIPAGEGGTHLHFNIYKGSASEGNTVDPEGYIKFR